MLLMILYLAISVVALFYGAEFSLEASEKIGHKLKMSPLAIGMLLVGFGTSLPEFFVAHIAAFNQDPGVAFGTLIGSNIANILLILGVSSLISKLSMSGRSLIEQLWVHLLLSCTLVFILTREVLNIEYSLALLGIIIVYLFFVYRDMSRELDTTNFNEQPLVKNEKPAGVLVVKMIIGFTLLYVGGELLVFSGSRLAQEMGVSSYIVSAIFIAFGTSFPELVTSLLAVIKKKDTDIIVGNIIGSNVFNCGFILGSMGVYNLKISQDFSNEIITLLISSSALLLFAYVAKAIGKLAGVLFLCLYAFVVFSWLQ